MTRTKQAPAATPEAVPDPRAEQLAELRCDWLIHVLQHATDPQIKHVVVETAARTGRRLHGHGELADQAWIAQIAAEAGCLVTTAEAVLDAVDRICARPTRSVVPQRRRCGAGAARPSEPQQP